MKRPVYDVRTLTGRTSESLADALGAAFEFVPLPWPTQRMRPSPAACSSAASQTACCI